MYEPEIETLSLKPSSGGVFEVVVNDTLLYSKKANGRHANKGEVAHLMTEYLAAKKK